MSDLITKHNQVIKASYRLTPNEQAIIIVALSNISIGEEVTDETMYTLKIDKLAEMTGTDISRAYKYFKDAAISLYRRELMISNGKKRLTRWIQTVDYIDGTGLIEIRFNKDILPYLTNLKDNFTSYNLKNVSKFKSTYGIRIYELIKQWQHTKKDVDITVEDMKKMFQLEESYSKRIDNLKRKVLEPAIKDINSHSDINISYENIKTGRKITGFKFTWKAKKTKPKKISNEYIAQHARAGESWDEARNRLNNSLKE